MTSNPIPYDPIGTPKSSKVEYNGANFEVTEWTHQGDYKGKVIYVHGFCEEATLYTEYFDLLSQAGYDIFFFDQRGSGKTSPGKAFGVTDSVHAFDDLDFFIKRNADASPGEKFVLMGHSMGGGIVLNYGVMGKYKEHIRAIVACAPMVFLHPKTNPNIILRTFQPVINKIAPGVKIDSKLVVEYVTNNEKWRRYIKNSNALFIGTVRLFNDMFDRGKNLTDPAFVKKFDPSIALLVLHGDTDYINALEGSKKFYSLLPDTVVKKKFIEVKDARHSLFLENDATLKKLLQDILEFLS